MRPLSKAFISAEGKPEVSPKGGEDVTSQSQLLCCIREVSSPRAWYVSEKRFSSAYHRVPVERGLGPHLARKNDLKEQSHPMTG